MIKTNTAETIVAVKHLLAVFDRRRCKNEVRIFYFMHTQNRNAVINLFRTVPYQATVKTIFGLTRKTTSFKSSLSDNVITVIAVFAVFKIIARTVLA